MKKLSPMTVGELLDRLRALPPDMLVELKADIFSYRGDYSQPAIAYGWERESSSCQAIIEEIEEVLSGRLHCGYKDAGECRDFFKTQVIHVARDYSEWSQLTLVGVEDSGTIVVIEDY